MKMPIAKLLSSKFFFFLLTAIVILGLNLTPLIMQSHHSPMGRTFTLLHNNTQDYYFYQSLMGEGANGANLTYDPYTSEPHQPSIIFSYFLWLGKLSKIFNISYALTYHLSRIILGLLFLLSAFCFLLSIGIPYPRLTYLFFLFAAPFMHTINDYGTLRSVPFMSWWNGMDPIRRSAFLPHHMLGGILLILSIIIIFRYIKTPARAALARLTVISAMMAFVHTPSLLILLLILPPSIFFYLILNKKSSPDTKYIGLLVYWFIGLFFLFAMLLQTKSGFPWSQYIDWEKNLQFPLERELIGALGILFPFSLIGIFSAIKSRKFENIFIVCWLVVPFLFIPVASKLNLSNIRLIQGVPYLPLAILAILGIRNIENAISTFILKRGGAKEGSQTKLHKEAKINNLPLIFGGLKRSLGNLSDRTPKLILLIMILIFFIFTYPTLKWSLADQIREYWPIYGNVYLDNRLFDAFAFINNNYPAKTVTLSTFYTGNYLPVFTHTVSFIGHFGYTYNEEAKEKATHKFFANQMSLEEARKFIMSNKIVLVFQGPEEKPLYKNYLYPDFLKPVYDKEEAIIYKFNF